MREVMLFPSRKKRMKRLKKIRKSNSKWKWRSILFTVTNLLSALIVLAAAVYAFTGPDVDIAQGILFVLLILIFPTSFVFISGYLPWYYGRYYCTQPYGSRANEHLILSEDSLTLLFWYVKKNNPMAYGIGNFFLKGDENVYSIPKSNIEDIYIDENDICHIKGQGFFRPSPTITDSKAIQTMGAYDVSKGFSFIIDFTDDNAKSDILNWIKSLSIRN